MSLCTPVTVALKSNPDCCGVMVQSELLVVNDVGSATGFRLIPKVGVVWDDDNMRSPCPSFHDPAELLYLDCPQVSALESAAQFGLGGEDEDEDEDEETEAEEEEEVKSSPAPGTGTVQ